MHNWKRENVLIKHVCSIRKRALFALIVTVVALPACTTPEGTQREPELITVKVGTLPYISYAPFFIAEEEGFFAEQGIQVEFVKSGNVSESVASLVRGELDVAGGTVNAGFLNAMARGTQIRYVADKSHISPTSCNYAAFIARRVLFEAGKLDSPTQLAGRTIAIPDSIRSSALGYYIEALLGAGNLTLDDIKIVDLPSPAQIEALKRGSVDLILSGEPWVTRILDAGDSVLWMPVQQVVPEYQHAVILYGPSLLNDNPDAGKRFMVAYLKAIRQYNQGKTDRNVEILAEHTGLEPELIARVCLPPMRDDGWIDADSVIDFQNWAVEKGFLDDVLSEDDFWDPSFVEYAGQVLNESSQ